MLIFKPLTLDAYPELLPYFMSSRSRLCDWTPDVAFMWRRWFKTEWTTAHSALIFKYQFPGIGETFSVPCGGDAVAALREFGCARPVFSNVAENELPLLKSVFRDMNAKDERDWYDYIYDAQSLAYFSGKKLHGQKNHLNRFNKAYPGAVFEELNASNIGDVRDFFTRYLAVKPPDEPILGAESEMIYEYLDNFGVYRSFGGLIRIDGAVAAFSLGETVGDTTYVHIEKADTSYPGVYQKLVSEFARRFCTENEDGQVPFMNREEDVGDEGLRASKLSYHPRELLKKYTVRT